MSDCSDRLREAVCDALARAIRLSVVGNGSRAAVAGEIEGELLSVSEHRGIVEHAPEELVVTVRAGTTVRELTAELARADQRLAFEPARFDREGTVGGLVACNASGPSRPFVGGVRDAVLGVELINGLGERCRFGGQVMKNVAGYDIARLQAGSFGQFGVLLSVSFRLAPAPERTECRQLPVSGVELASTIARLRRQVPALSGLAWCDDVLHARVEGTSAGVDAALTDLGGEPDEPSFWHAVAEHHTPQLASGVRGPLGVWRVSTDPLTALSGEELLVDWAGGVRWLPGDADPSGLLHPSGSFARRVGGTRAGELVGLDPNLTPLRTRLQAAFDPDGIFRRAELS